MKRPLDEDGFHLKVEVLANTRAIVVYTGSDESTEAGSGPILLKRSDSQCRLGCKRLG